MATTKKGNGAAKLFTIIKNCCERDGVCGYSNPIFAGMLDCKTRTVQHLLAKLRDLGLIKVNMLSYWAREIHLCQKEKE